MFPCCRSRELATSQERGQKLSEDLDEARAQAAELEKKFQDFSRDQAEAISRMGRGVIKLIKVPREQLGSLTGTFGSCRTNEEPSVPCWNKLSCRRDDEFIPLPQLQQEAQNNENDLREGFERDKRQLINAHLEETVAIREEFSLSKQQLEENARQRVLLQLLSLCKQQLEENARQLEETIQ